MASMLVFVNLLLLGVVGGLREESFQTVDREMIEANSRILAENRLKLPNPDELKHLTQTQLDAEKKAKQEGLELDPERFSEGSTLSQHRSFTAGQETSIKLGVEHRPKVVEVENTFKLLDLGTEDVKKLLASGFGTSSKCQFLVSCINSPYRSADGTCNNLLHSAWGKASIPMRRWLQPDYADGTSAPRGPNLPSARLVSREIHTDSGFLDQQFGYTHMLMQWGQFLDHDITKTPSQQRQPGYGGGASCCGAQNLALRPECFPIDIPAGDLHFNHTCMDFVRSVQVANTQCQTTPVEQVNEITAYIDASQVYGSSITEQHALRGPTDGLLKQRNEFLPQDSNSASCNTPFPLPRYCFKAGDERVNENPTLQSMHTIFVREHNRIARKLKELVQNTWTDEKLFQETRKIVGAEMQKITYGEYLPLILGSQAMTDFNLNVLTGSTYSNAYNSNRDASIKNGFATAAFRMGHSMIQGMMNSMNQLFANVGSNNLSDMFGDTKYILDDPVHTLGHFTRGLVHDCVQRAEKKISSEVTNNLFKDNLGRALDLAALNIQRGRDHGLPGYIHWRKFCLGGNLPTSFTQLFSTHTPAARTELQNVYSTVDKIDLFTGALTEMIGIGQTLGPTFTCLLGKQFQDLKIGDRFWFEENNVNVRFTPEQLEELRKVTLSRVICDNTDTFTIQENAFIKNITKLDCCDLPSIDLTKWIPATWNAWTAWGACRSDGLQTRTRTCRMGDCQGPNTDFKHCSGCTWGSWGPCSSWLGQRTRQMTCKKSCLVKVLPVDTIKHSVIAAGNK